MNNIELCVIGRKSADFTAHLAVIRQINGLKVLKRRNKPFYDVSGTLNDEPLFLRMCGELSYLMNNCDAQIEIQDEQLRDKIVKLL